MVMLPSTGVPTVCACAGKNAATLNTAASANKMVFLFIIALPPISRVWRPNQKRTQRCFRASLEQTGGGLVACPSLFFLLLLVCGLNLGANGLEHRFYVGGVWTIRRKFKILVQGFRCSGRRLQFALFILFAVAQHQRSFDEIGIGPVGICLDRLVASGQRALRVAAVVLRGAKIEVSCAWVGIHRRGFGIGLNGLIILFQLEICVAFIGEHLRHRGLSFGGIRFRIVLGGIFSHGDHLFIGINRFLVLAEVHLHISQRLLIFPVGRFGSDHLL